MPFFKTKTEVTRHIDASEFKQLVESGKGVILDVRTPEEVTQGHIKGTLAINIADPAFKTKIDEISRDQPVYVYCLTGARSRLAARIMEKSGFSEIYNLSKGIVSWYKAGYPLVAE